MNARVYPIRRESCFLRTHAEAEDAIQSETSSKAPGTIYIEFWEEWEWDAEATFDPNVDRKNSRRVAQTPTGRTFRISEADIRVRGYVPEAGLLEIPDARLAVVRCLPDFSNVVLERLS